MSRLSSPSDDEQFQPPEDDMQMLKQLELKQLELENLAPDLIMVQGVEDCRRKMGVLHPHEIGTIATSKQSDDKQFQPPEDDQQMLMASGILPPDELEFFQHSDPGDIVEVRSVKDINRLISPIITRPESQARRASELMQCSLSHKRRLQAAAGVFCPLAVIMAVIHLLISGAITDLVGYWMCLFVCLVCVIWLAAFTSRLLEEGDDK